MHTKMYLMMVFICICIVRLTDAQTTIVSMPLEITYNKTSSIIFPAIITSVDKGSRDVLLQKAKGAENVLQLKAARENFLETNLTVITTDGILYQFTVTYSQLPNTFAVDLQQTVDQQDTVPVMLESKVSQPELERYAQSIINAKKPWIPMKKRNHKITLLLKGIYIRDNVMFYHFQARNQSNITYDVDFIQFFIRDRVKVKRTASQERDVKPIYVYGDDKQIKDNSSQDIVFAVSKFTIPYAKRLVIEMFEESGGRNVRLTIPNRAIINARLIE